ncbi:hypothetical protein SERLADRAFT_441968 [Serpula lacrymans var. lacrymans S7.9]|uniref:Uncharacterized protein n=1 Tax=Serpula lacrymans var. lacrymans (strain S7.9) TaxID=578457 RepID=F8P862_SERL9|nr:uncharacterized protein SERLADRAFT_441968 [Serpula lacrymans var. lacrymans S7.9]EGO20619.1 hypothetical protein SERLADRAFT_441968 [Serpula lacrymans var. lacrymans S7.9]
MRVVPTVNSRVKPYKGQLLEQCVDQPGLGVVTQEGEEEFKAEWVVDACLKCGKLELLNPLALQKPRGMDLNLFNSLFQPMLKTPTTTSSTWYRLKVKP